MSTPVTFAVAGLCILAFAFVPVSALQAFGEVRPAALEAALIPVRLMFGGFLHNDFFHIGLNLVVWVILGREAEQDRGSRWLFYLLIAALCLGGLIEGLLFDLNFTGLSPACFGLMTWMIWKIATTRSLPLPAVFTIAATGLILVLDSVIAGAIQSGQTAIGAHIGGSMAGFLSALGIGGRRSVDGLVFRAMRADDVQAVLDIIYDFDEDDGEEAEASFANSLAHKYVVEADGSVIGMSGYTAEDQAKGVAWLSWTYVHKDFRRHGAAFFMMQELRRVLEKSGFRKVFIETSDYKDEETGEDIYGPARRFYQSKLNARKEAIIRDYYGAGESKYIYSLPVTDIPAPSVPMDRSFHPIFVDIDAADESETGFVILWEETTQPQSQSGPLTTLIARAQSQDAHALFLTLTTSLSDNAAAELSAAGFEQLGKLKDFYAPGVDDVYWGLYF